MKLIIMPTSEDVIRLSQPEDEVVLMATCEPNKICNFFGMPNFKGLSKKNLIGGTLNLTSSTVRAYYDSAGKTIILLAVKKRYLKKVHGSLNGWSCEVGSPMKLLQQQPGQREPTVIRQR